MTAREIEKFFVDNAKKVLTSLRVVIDFASLRAPEDDERASLVRRCGADSVAIDWVVSQEATRLIADGSRT